MYINWVYIYIGCIHIYIYLYVGVILGLKGLYRGDIGIMRVMYGLHGDSGKENGKYYSMLGL